MNHYPPILQTLVSQTFQRSMHALNKYSLNILCNYLWTGWPLQLPTPIKFPSYLWLLFFLLLYLRYSHCLFAFILQSTTNSRLLCDVDSHGRLVILERMTSLCMSRSHLQFNSGHPFFFKDSTIPVARDASLTTCLLRFCLTGCVLPGPASSSPRLEKWPLQSSLPICGWETPPICAGGCFELYYLI